MLVNPNLANICLHASLFNSSGHLMGKKSIETLPELQQANPDSDYLTPPETEPGRYERLMEALVQQNNLKQMKAQIAGRLLHVGSGWRQEDRDKYLREVSPWGFIALFMCLCVILKVFWK